MKIVQINVTLNSGSTGRIVEEIGKAVLKNGWESYVFYGRRMTSSKSKHLKVGNQLSIYAHVLFTRLFDRHGLHSNIATKRIIKQLRIIKPNIIHLHNIHGYYLNYITLFKFLSKNNIPIVWTMHDCWPITGHCAYFDFVKCQKWQSKCYSCPQKKNYPSALFLDRSSLNFKNKKEVFTSLEKLTIVPVSNWLDGILNKSYLSGFPRKVIHNGIDIDQFNITASNFRVKYKLENKFIVLGVASTWEERKGLKDFFKLADALTVGFMIVLIGLTTQQISGLPKNIIGIERTENVKQLSEIYSSADVFFNPTREDNYPTTNLEAISCGTPVITYKTGGSVESINANTGYIINKGDLEECKRILYSLNMNKSNQTEYLCRDYSEKWFSQDIMSNSYINLYKEVLKS